MKKNRITMEIAQERANTMHGDSYFTIIDWNGTKKMATISYGEYNPVVVEIKQGEYLYKRNMAYHVESRISDAVQKHLDNQNKKITIVEIEGQLSPAVAICHCCGEELHYSKGLEITSKDTACTLCESKGDRLSNIQLKYNMEKHDSCSVHGLIRSEYSEKCKTL